ncbi:ACP S-malonyltransferase [Streptomyces orinoci]|uniref:[acyl-carrier-protein] S-malonyltransferase n=1 Tax=Streptomyces orinoci TaxID=67339 RepID=A0ABV3K7X5_STRON|nr:ACP S-malonyltransferase [Streptomyces orinoci]
MAPSDFSAAGKFMVLDEYVRRRLPIADKVLGYSLLDRFYESGDEYSEAAQAAFLVNSLALADRAVQRLGMRADYCTGPSFGQKAAAVFTGAMDFADALRMTVEHARCEEEFFATEYSDVVTHTAVRVPEDALREYLDSLTAQGHWYDISGRLDDGFLMVSLREPLLDGLKKAISAMGGYSMSTMRPPVHARAFAGLRAKAEAEFMSGHTIGAPGLPVIADQDGRIVETADDLRAMMMDTFDRPLDWPAVVRTLKDLGVAKVYIPGPENLFRRVRCTVRNFEVVSVDPKSTLREILRPVRTARETAGTR